MKDTNSKFLSFYTAISQFFYPIKRIFIKNSLFLENQAVLHFSLIIVQNAKGRLCSLVSWPTLLKTLFKFHQEWGGALLFIPELPV